MKIQPDNTNTNPYKGIGKRKIRIGLLILWLLVVAFLFIVRTILKWR